MLQFNPSMITYSLAVNRNNFVPHPKSYTETTDRRDFGDKLSKWNGIVY